MFEIFLNILFFVIIFIIIISIIITFLIYIFPPKIRKAKILSKERAEISTNSFEFGKSWIRKNRNNLFEMYVEGEAFELGYSAGKLTKELFEFQENVFVNELKLKVPSIIFRFVLKIAIGIVNRKIAKHIGNEYCQEIYGISKSASKKFFYLAPAYLRILNYHAAHDIGHALQDKKYVGCTAFSVKNDMSEDGKLIVGRNFDFYINDDFCKDKILAFYNPTNGNKFAMITWAGMIGVVSGMNIKGISVSLNGAKSDIPKKSATPVSIVAREILQYANNLSEAINIANNRTIFVSESIMVSSAYDKKSIIIEKTPFKTDVYSCDFDSVICTNHFQSEKLRGDKSNIENINESSTMYRYNRVKELLDVECSLNASKIAKILRNNKGINNADIGLGNEKTINQIIAHHSVIFIPDKLIMYVSTNPCNLGEYMAYDLNHIFNNMQNGCPKNDIDEINCAICCDEFLTNGNYQNYVEFKEIISKLNIGKININDENKLFDRLCELNPEFYLTYTSIGDFLYNKKRFSEALIWYSKSLTKEFYHLIEKQKIEKLIVKCKV